MLDYKAPSSFAIAILAALQQKPVFGGVEPGVREARRRKGRAAKQARKNQRGNRG